MRVDRRWTKTENKREPEKGKGNRRREERPVNPNRRVGNRPLSRFQNDRPSPSKKREDALKRTERLERLLPQLIEKIREWDPPTADRLAPALGKNYRDASEMSKVKEVYLETCRTLAEETAKAGFDVKSYSGLFPRLVKSGSEKNLEVCLNRVGDAIKTLDRKRRALFHLAKRAGMFQSKFSEIFERGEEDPSLWLYLELLDYCSGRTDAEPVLTKARRPKTPPAAKEGEPQKQ